MKINELLVLFDLREIEKHLYQVLFNDGFMTATQLAKRTGVSRTSVYDLLERLKNTGLITESTKGGVRIYDVAPPVKVQLLIEDKESQISAAKLMLQQLQHDYQSNRKSVKPHLQLFEGRRELQQMMMDMLLYRDITVYAFWPVQKIVSLLTPEFFATFHQQRVARNNQLRVIWPKNQILPAATFPFLSTNPKLKREARIAPQGIDFSLGYAVYGDTVRFISSSKENFGFLVGSPELAEMMKVQFQLIWRQSKQI